LHISFNVVNHWIRRRHEHLRNERPFEIRPSWCRNGCLCVNWRIFQINGLVIEDCKECPHVVLPKKRTVCLVYGQMLDPSDCVGCASIHKCKGGM